MPLAEAAATAIATKVLQEALSAGASGLKKGRAAKVEAQALAGVVERAYARFERRHSDWAHALVDASFLEREMANNIAKLLLPGASLSPSLIANAWADSLAIKSPDRRRARVRELEAPVGDLLGYLREELVESGEFREVLHEQTLVRISEDIAALARELGAGRATPGTRLDYLRWVGSRYSHIDPRGIYQTERSVQVPLDQVFVGLRVDEGRDPLPSDSEDRVRRVDADRSLALETALNQPAVVVLGDPGSGKTTVLRYLALKHAEAQLVGSLTVDDVLGPPRIPILIRIADYAESGTSMPLSIYMAKWHRLAEAPSDGLAELFETALEAGDALVLLDGLDEIVSSDDRRKVVRRIDDLVQRFLPIGNRFVVTSRIAGYRELPLGGSFESYRIRPMSREQIHAFLAGWCRAVEGANPDLTVEQREANTHQEISGVTTAIVSSPGVEQLATNPLLLTILALIHRAGAALPQRRIALYELAVSTLARTWRQAQGVPAAALAEETLLTRVLSTVAYWLHVTRPSGVASLDDLKPVVEARWAEVEGLDWDVDSRPREVVVKVDEFLSVVRVQTGLLVERAPDRYGFMHLTFEEYYVARELVSRHRSSVERIRAHLHDPRWEEPILLALGFRGLSSADDAATLVDAAILARGEEGEGVEPSADEELLGRDVLFALRCLGDLVPMNRATRNELLTETYAELMHATGRGSTASYRMAVFGAFTRLPSADHAFLLNLGMGDWNAGWTDVWIHDLAPFEFVAGSPDFLAELLEQWSEQPEKANVHGLWELAAKGDEFVIEWLSARAKDADAPLNGVCAAVLSQATPPEAREVAFERLRAGLARKGPDALGDIGAASHPVRAGLAGPLLAVVHTDPEAYTATDDDRWVVAEVLNAGFETAGLAEQLLDEIATGDPAVAWVAAEAMEGHVEQGSPNQQRLIEAICTRIHNTTSDDELRHWLTQLDERLNVGGLAPTVIDLVEPLLDHESAGVRIAALGVLLWDDVSPAQIARVLCEDLNGEDRTAFAQLAALDPAQLGITVDRYIEEAGSESHPAAVAQSGYGAPARLRLLRELAREEKARARSTAMLTLARVGTVRDRRRVAKHVETLPPSELEDLALAMGARHDDLGADAIVDALAALDVPTTFLARLFVAVRTGSALDLTDVRAGLDHPDEVIVAKTIDLVADSGLWPESVLPTVLERMRKRPYLPDVERAAMEAIVGRVRVEGGLAGSTYQTLRQWYLDAPKEPQADDYDRRSGLYELLVAAAAAAPRL